MRRPLYTPEQWNEIFERYLASGLTQRRFCEQNAVPFDTFRHRYRKSEKFAGRRRDAPARRVAAPGDGGFVAIRSRGADAMSSAAAVSIRLGGGVTIECPLGIGAAAIASTPISAGHSMTTAEPIRIVVAVFDERAVVAPEGWAGRTARNAEDVEARSGRRLPANLGLRR